MAAAQSVIIASVWLLQEKYLQTTSKSSWVNIAPTASKGMVIARRFFIFACSILNQSAIVRRALLKAVSPEEIGQTTTPTIASAQPTIPSRDTDMSYTTPDCPSSESAF